MEENSPTYPTTKQPPPPIPPSMANDQHKIPGHQFPRFVSKKLAVVILILIAIIFASGIAYQYFEQQKLKAITDFESCAAAGNPIAESYPATCRDGNDNVYTQKLSDEEKEKLDLQSSIADWETYTNTKFGFTFKYPNDMNSDCWGNFEHCTFDRFTGPGRGPENFIWFQLIPLSPKARSGEYYNGNDIDSFLEDENSIVNTNPKFPDLAKYFTYTRLKDKKIDSFNAMVFENNSPWESKSGTVERRNIFIKGDYIYVIGAYTESDDISLKLFDQILSTFKFTDSITTLPVNNDVACAQDARECPDGSWVGRTGPECKFVCPISD